MNDIAAGAPLDTHSWRGACRAFSPPPPGCGRLPTESRQNPLGGLQLIELLAQLCPFGIEPREPIGNPLLS